jgi:hypothetical protein
MQLRYPVSQATKIIEIPNAQLRDANQFITDQQIKFTRNRDVIIYGSKIVQNKRIFSFDSTVCDDINDLIEFFKLTFGQWVRLIDHNSEHYKIKILNSVLEWISTENFNQFSIEFINNKDIFRLYSASVSLDQEFETSSPVVGILGNDPTLFQKFNVTKVKPAIAVDSEINQTFNLSQFIIASSYIVVSLDQTFTTSAFITPVVFVDVSIHQYYTENIFDAEVAIAYYRSLSKITVTNDPFPGSFKDINTAISFAIEFNIKHIYVDDGTYSCQITDIGTDELLIEGHSKETVTIEYTTDNPIISLDTKTFDSITFKNITFDPNIDSSTDLDVYDFDTCTGNVMFDNCVFTSNYTGDDKFTHLNFYHHTGKIDVLNCDFEYGLSGIYCDTIGGIRIINTTLSEIAIPININNDNCEYQITEIAENDIIDPTENSIIYIKTASSKFAIVVDNEVDVNDSVTDSSFAGIFVHGKYIVVERNIINIVINKSMSAVYGINAILDGVMFLNTIRNNSISLEIDSSLYNNGIYVSAYSDSENLNVTENTIYIDDSTVTWTNLGIRLHTTSYDINNSIIEKNVIDLVNSSAKDIGISLATGTSNIHGLNNVVRNYGTALDDDGTDNSVGVI